MNFVLKMMKFAFKMMTFAGELISGGVPQVFYASLIIMIF